ncbi:PH domain-containing protein [Jatrophihabitans sp. YIM 134969]
MTNSVPAPPRERVSRSAIGYWTVRALPGWVVIGGVEAAVLFPVGPPAAVWLPIVLVTLALAVLHVVVMPQWRYRIHRWEQSPTAFQTQSGWLVVERRIAPLSRVQTVDLERGVLENLFGLATLTVTTASAAGALQVPALDRDVAERLSAELARVAGDSPDDAT